VKRRGAAPAPAPSLDSRPQSLNEAVYGELRRQILWGEIVAGSTLSVRGLSGQFPGRPIPVQVTARAIIAFLLPIIIFFR